MLTNDSDMEITKIDRNTDMLTQLQSNMNNKITHTVRERGDIRCFLIEVFRHGNNNPITDDSEIDTLQNQLSIDDNLFEYAKTNIINKLIYSK